MCFSRVRVLSFGGSPVGFATVFHGGDGGWPGLLVMRRVPRPRVLKAGLGSRLLLSKTKYGNMGEYRGRREVFSCFSSRESKITGTVPSVPKFSCSEPKGCIVPRFPGPILTACLSHKRVVACQEFRDAK